MECKICYGDQLMKIIIFCIFFNFLSSESRNVTIGLLVRKSHLPTVDIAVKYINRNSTFGIFMKTISRRDFNCTDQQILGVAADFHYKTNGTVDVFIGPDCPVSCLPATSLSAFLEKPMFSPACSSINFDASEFSHEKNKVFARTGYSRTISFKTSYNDAALKQLIRLLDIFDWNLICIIVSESEKWYLSGQHVQNHLKDYNRSASFLYNYDSSDKHYKDDVLEGCKSEARIFLLHGEDEEVAQILVEAYRKNMFNGEYGFITTGFRVHKEWSNGMKWMKGLDPREVFNGFLDFSTASIVSITENKHYKDFLKKLNKTYIHGEKVDETAAYLHDAINLYALAYKNTVANGKNPNSIVDLMENVYNIKFEGVSGLVEIDGKGDRIPPWYELNYYQKGTILEECVQQLIDVTSHENRTVLKPCQYFNWPGGRIPKDIPVCGFKNEKCWDTTVIVIVIAIILVLITLAAFLIYKKKKLQKDLFGTGFIIDSDDISNLMNGKEINVYQHNGRVKGSFEDSSSPMNQVLLDCVSMASTKNQMMDTLSMISATESLRARNVFSYKGEKVIMKRLKRNSVNLSKEKEIRLELSNVRQINHPNLCPIIGVCVQSPNVCVLEQYSSKQSLEDVLQNENIKLDMMFRESFVSDIASGGAELHRNGIIHGRLTSRNCVVDNRLVCKITDYGMDKFRQDHYDNCNDEMSYQKYRKMLWKAPELLQEKCPKKTKEGDVYGFGIIISEILTRNDPYAECQMEPEEIIRFVKAGGVPVFRPKVWEVDENDNSRNQLMVIMKSCWDELPHKRPTFEKVKGDLKRKGNIMDWMVSLMEQYSKNLEERVRDQNAELCAEKAKNDELLYKMLPAPIAKKLKDKEQVEADSFDSVTIFFSDIVGFTSLSSCSTPMQIVALLNDLYTSFDRTIDNYDVYKVETIGDAYMVVSGLPVRNGIKHAGEIATMSLDLLYHIKAFRIRHLPDRFLQLRIGIHSGPCVAGVVGQKMPRYCLFGDTVNYASRMESSGLALRIHVSPECRKLLDQLGGYTFLDRGPVEMKGKGIIHTSFLTGYEKFTKSLPDLTLAAALQEHQFK